MPILTICQSCGVQVYIPKSVIRAARAAQCPKCKAVLTGPTVALLPDKKPRSRPSPKPAPPTNLVSIGPCAACGTPLSVPPEALGRWIQCTHCGAGLAAVADGTSPADEGPRRGINWAGLILAAGAVLLVLIAVVVGSLVVGGRPAQTQPVGGGGRSAPPAAESKKDKLLRRLAEIRTTREALQKKRTEIERNQREEDQDLDAVLAVNKELHRLEDEEKQLTAELEGAP